MKKRKGFTIIELLVALVIVGILLTLAILVINRYIIQGHNTVNDQLERSLVLSAKSYFSDNKRKIISNTDEDGNIVLWYTYLKSNNYISNDLKDAKGNSCSKSYVYMTKSGNGYKYTGCVVCDNGYTNTKGNKVCTENFDNVLSCNFTSDKKKIGVKQGKNIANVTLVCKGKDINVAKNNLYDMFSTTNGTYSSLEDSNTSKEYIDSKKKQFKVVGTYTSSSDAFGEGKVMFKENSITSKYKGSAIPNVQAELGIEIDGKGPSCKLSRAYADENLNTLKNIAKNGEAVYYKITCDDDSKINGFIKKEGFDSKSDVVVNTSSNKQYVSEKKVSAIIKVVINESDGIFKLKYNANQIYDEYDNGNDMVSDSAGLIIDNTGPVCVFKGPYSDFNLTSLKTQLDISDNITDYVVYSLSCSDINGIDKSSFNISDVTYTDFSKIEYVSNLSTSNNFIIKAYEKNKDGAYAYLSFDTKNIKDNVGNNGNGVINSDNVKMVDKSKMPSCNITVAYDEDKTSATLTGTMRDEVGLSGYLWTNGYSVPSYFMNTSGHYQTVYNTVDENGFYYLHVKNEVGNTANCLAYVNEIEEKAPDAPTLVASDSISSGKWHKDDYTLEASGSGSNVTYYYGTSANNIYSTEKPSVSTETSSTTYYAKACRGNNTKKCSGYVTYVAKLDKTPPTCTLSGTKTKDNNKYTSGKWTMSDIKVSLSADDATSGVKSKSMVSPSTGDTVHSYFTTNVSDGSNWEKSVTATCIDNAGNKATSSSFSMKIDKKDPVITILPKNTEIKGETEISFTCTDSGSGVDTKSITSPKGNTYTGKFKTSGGTVTAKCKDVVGNTATKSKTYHQPCTKSWHLISTTYPSSCKETNNGSTKVTCSSSSYYVKTTYTGSCTGHDYSWGSSSNAATRYCSSGVSIKYCTSSNKNLYKYYWSGTGTKRKCKMQKCEESCSRYGNYTSSTSNVSSCSTSGRQGATKTYTTCSSKKTSITKKTYEYKC